MSHSELYLFLLPNCSSLKDMIKQNQVCEVCVDKNRNNSRATVEIQLKMQLEGTFRQRCELRYKRNENFNETCT